MRFKDPLFLLLLIPVILFFFLYLFGMISREASLKFSSVGLVRRAGGKKSGFRRFVTAVLRLAVLTLLTLAVMRPQTAASGEKSIQHVVDMMVALDISGSMASLDFQPDNRLTAAKMEARRFIEGRPDDRVGLVIFAGQSVTQCPLTVDHKAILSLLDQIQIGMVEDGTAIGLGLGNAVNRLRGSEAKSKVIVLLTDGVNTTGEIDPITAAGLAKQYNIRVYTIGVGKEGYADFPVRDPLFGIRFRRMRTEIDEKLLAEIAAATGGKYFRAQDRDALRAIFREIDRLEKTEVPVEKFVHRNEEYFRFLWPALILLVAEILWTDAVMVKIP